jgi:hypothetical protein
LLTLNHVYKQKQIISYVYEGHKWNDTVDTLPVSRSEENRAQIASDVNGKLDGEVGACSSSCSPVNSDFKYRK